MEARAIVRAALRASTPLALLAVAAVFSLLSGEFLTASNGLNILVQSSATGVLAVGMTFVLLTAGVDLSVGATMYLAGIAAGLLGARGLPVPAAAAVALAVGLAAGAVNGLCVAWLRLVPFVVTLALMHVSRGAGLVITETQGVSLPEAYQTFGAGRWLGVPLPVWTFAGVLLTAHLVLRHTPFGRQLYAAGHDLDAAAKAGVRTGRILFVAYVVCGFCAAVAALIAMSQTGSVASKFGLGREFSAIAAAVLGGTSLFGGRGNVIPGVIIGAVFVQTVENGLVLIDADPYTYPLVTAAVIFAAVLVDSFRRRG